jgi:competence protein ComEC
MKVIAVEFLLGVLLLQRLPVLTSAGFGWLLLIAIACVAWNKRLRLPRDVGGGFLWALVQARCVLYPGLGRALKVAGILVSGVIAFSPEPRDYAARFLFDIEHVCGLDATGRSIPDRVRLNRYGDISAVRLGQRWRFAVPLKRPWGILDPRDFDYEGWLYS